jgi:signal recognition particle GTPase
LFFARANHHFPVRFSPLLTGEHIDQFEHFESKRFVQRLLGKGDVTGLMDKIQDVIPEDKQPELLENISKVGRGAS